jgi:hypothetical protein
MAFKDGEKPLFGQVKSNRASGITTFHEDCIEKQFPFDFADVEFWICYDDEGWRVDEVTQDGYETVVDERDEDCKMGEIAEAEKSKTLDDY